MIVVSDTSVLTSLIHIGRVVLLHELHGSVLIPRAVHHQLKRTHTDAPALLEVRDGTNREMVSRAE